METRSVKRRKLLDAEKKSAGEDRLTDLPDAVLHCILFLLPIKSIAQTCVLSKRWRHIWYSLPDLDFTTVNDSHYHGMDFINHVLSIRAKQHCCNSDIRVLRIRASLMFSQLHGLMRFAVRHNVQNLEIDVFTDDSFNLPRSVLNSDSLKILKLKSLEHGFRLPPWSIMKEGFRTLQTLTLSVVILYQQPKIVMDCSSFPLLRKLSMDNCRGLKHLSVYCQALVKFSLSECLQLDSFKISCPKLEKLRVLRCFDTMSTKSCVMIDAPKLDKIIWNGNAITDHSSIANLPSLQEACIGFESVTAANLLSLSKFFTGLSQSKCLKLERPCFEFLSKNDHFAGVILEPFVNLKSLELRTSNIQGLASLFRTSLSPHKLIISIISDYKVQTSLDRNFSSSSGDEEYWKSQSRTFKPFFHELKNVAIHGISEIESDFSLVKFLLGHTDVLQEMVISCAAGIRGCRRLERIELKVMQFSRASSDAKVVFC